MLLLEVREAAFDFIRLTTHRTIANDCQLLTCRPSVPALTEPGHTKDSLVINVTSSQQTKGVQVPDLLGRDAEDLPVPSGPPLGASSSLKLQQQVKDFEASVEATMKRFASGLQRVLQDINRCASTPDMITRPGPPSGPIFGARLSE